MTQNDEMLAWRGHEVVDRYGDRIGRLEEIYLDAETDRPEWGAVKTGLFGHKLTFVPLAQAQLRDEMVTVSFDKGQVKDAPSVDPAEELSPDEEDELYRHYGLDAGGGGRPDERHGGDHRGTDHRGADRHGEATQPLAQSEDAREEPRGARGEADRSRDERGRAHRGRDELGADEHGREAHREPSGGGEAPRGGPGPEEHRESARAGGEARREGAGAEQQRDRGRDGAWHEQAADGERASGRRSGVRLRRHIVTEYLSESGEVTKRETRTEEDLGAGHEGRPG
jgi:hypothetical protein